MNDILLDDNDDLLIQNGDFVIGESEQQEVEAILRAYPGWYKQFPTVGVGIMDYLNGPDFQKLQPKIQIQLQQDGKQLTSFSSSFDADGNAIITINGQEVDV